MYALKAILATVVEQMICEGMLPNTVLEVCAEKTLEIFKQRVPELVEIRINSSNFLISKSDRWLNEGIKWDLAAADADWSNYQGELDSHDALISDIHLAQEKFQTEMEQMIEAGKQALSILDYLHVGRAKGVTQVDELKGLCLEGYIHDAVGDPDSDFERYTEVLASFFEERHASEKKSITPGYNQKSAAGRSQLNEQDDLSDDISF
ncbi:MAG: hypothetical protein IPG93_09320 [Burkholderiales bacterium]|nr:hypothetical protein [Burkholderiales bacterium]